MRVGSVIRASRVRRVRVQRVALVAPRAQLRDMLIHIASFGWVDLEQSQLVEEYGTATPLALSGRPARGVSAFDAELERQAARAVDAGPAAALLGWVPAPFLDQLAAELAPVGGLLVVLAVRGRSKRPRLPRRLASHGSDALVPARRPSTAALANVSYLRGRTGLVATVTGFVRRWSGPTWPIRLVPGRDRDFHPWRLPPEDVQAPAGRADRQAAS